MSININGAHITAGSVIVQVYRLLLGVALLSAVSLADGQSDHWIQRAEIEYPVGNLNFRAGWNPESGLVLKVRETGSERTVLFRLRRKDSTVSLRPRNAFPPAARGTMELREGALPAVPKANAEVIVKFRPEAWAVYIEDALVVSLPPPFDPPATVSHPSANLPDEENIDVYFQKMADFRFEDNFLVPEEEEVKLVGWEIDRGTWKLYSVADVTGLAPAKRGAKNPRIPLPDYSHNFYSLVGHGTNAVITAGHDFYDSYSLEAATEVLPGEMGIVFCLRDASRFHAFTIRISEADTVAVLELWRTAGKVRERLAAATTRITAGQWVKLKAKTYHDRVQCFLDNAKVLDARVALPVGGRFGLFVNSDTEVRFDDVLAESNHDLELAALDEIHKRVILEKGEFLPRRRFFRLLRPRQQSALAPPVSRKPQWLVIGATGHKGHVFSAGFSNQEPTASFGLLAGYSGPDDPYYRFTLNRARGQESFVLEKVFRDAPKILERSPAPIDRGGENGTLSTLMFDASREGILRLYRNGRLVLVHMTDSVVNGASGLYVGPGTEVLISDLSYRSRRHDQYRNRFEKNRLFVEDPFMRHWSSPEGQWVTMENSNTWHKSDFFGRFLLRMPFIEGSQIHLGVPEGRCAGELVVAASGKRLLLTDGQRAGPPAAAEEEQEAVPLAAADFPPAPEVEEGQAETNMYTVVCEDYWLWATRNGELLFKHQLVNRLAGRRIRISGFTTEQLMHSYVERYNVKDHLFTESLHEWVRNGGRWETVNRFKCQERWSHMNGESESGFAALWAKYVYEGDFCMEMYVGIRHGAWYRRCGDLNLTVMNRDMTPSQGYSITCTGWDFDHSQLYTKFYRNGKVIAQSDKYLAPRIREENVRKGYNPLVKAGRDVHGAWYYVKLRRIGNIVQYYFDNELVFEIEDNKPIQAGSMGVWTFMNSMVVARVKMAAEQIRPKPLICEPLTGSSPRPAEQRPATAGEYVLRDGVPLECCGPEHWTVDDPVGRSQLAFHTEPGQGTYFSVRNVLGGGQMHAECRLPAVPYSKLAGWRFYVKRTPRARFNFQYSAGTLDSDGNYVARRSFFHRISGTDFSEGDRKMTGHTEVEGVATMDRQWHVDGDWTPVRVWIPTEPLRLLADGAGLLVKAEGFGNLQPSYTAQGLTGNGPGESYAVRDLCEIRLHPPQLTSGMHKNALLFRLLEDVRPGSDEPADLAAVSNRLAVVTGTGLIERWVETRDPDGSSRSPVMWISLPDAPEVRCAWSTKHGNLVTLEHNAPYPDRRFETGDVTVNDVAVNAPVSGFHLRTAMLPRSSSFAELCTNSVEVALTMNGTRQTFDLDLSARQVREPPVLLALDGAVAVFENFERRRLEANLGPDQSRMKLQHFDPAQGSYLSVFNAGKSHKLHTRFECNADLANYPLLQFRYRTVPMGMISLMLGARHYVRLSENHDEAVRITGTPRFQRDGQWHTWQGRVSDAVKGTAVHPRTFRTSHLDFGSFRDPDQTGRFSYWDVDDLVLGPAVSSAEQLTFTPHYFDSEGVESVLVSVRAGRECYGDLSAEALQSLQWRPATNTSPVTMPLGGLRDGACHLFLKAVDKRGDESLVTDIPFLLDTRPLSVTREFVKLDVPACNGTVLKLSVAAGRGAPPDLARFHLKWNGTRVPFKSNATHMISAPDNYEMLFNWPYIFREQLDAMSNGVQAQIAMVDLRDGAGNPLPDIVSSVTMNYMQDQTPPTLLPATYPTNVLWAAGWEAVPSPSPAESASGKLHFTAKYDKHAEIVHPDNEEPYLQLNPVKKEIAVRLNTKPLKWLIARHRYLAFRVRRPYGPPGEKTRIVMSLLFKDRQNLDLVLTGATSESRPRHRSVPIDWQSNTWHSVFVDLSELVSRTTEGEEMAEHPVTKLMVSQKGGAKDEVLHLQGLSIFAQWNHQDKVVLNAYDQSGMDGVSWRFEPAAAGPTTGSLTMTPALLKARDQGRGWLIMQAKDRAGNLSVPLRVPVWGPAFRNGDET